MCTQKAVRKVHFLMYLNIFLKSVKEYANLGKFYMINIISLKVVLWGRFFYGEKSGFWAWLSGKVGIRLFVCSPESGRRA